MSSLHEHWQTTDDEQPVPVHAASAPLPAMRQGARVSRTPAAILGMVLTLALGYYIVQSGTGIQGQVANEPAEPDILITTEGFDPPLFTVRPGATITLRNEDDIPHILRADTLPTPDGLAYESSPLFPGDSADIVLPPTAEAGTYEYYSTTSEFSGEIAIDPALPVASSSSSSALPEPVSSSSPAPLSSSSSPAPLPPSSASSAAPLPPAAEAPPVLPQNPYTVGSGDAPLPPRPVPGAQSLPPAASVTQHSPLMQPETGAGTWIIGLIGMLALYGTMRRAAR